MLISTSSAKMVFGSMEGWEMWSQGREPQMSMHLGLLWPQDPMAMWSFGSGPLLKHNRWKERLQPLFLQDGRLNYIFALKAPVPQGNDAPHTGQNNGSLRVLPVALHQPAECCLADHLEHSKVSLHQGNRRLKKKKRYSQAHLIQTS